MDLTTFEWSPTEISLPPDFTLRYYHTFITSGQGKEYIFGDTFQLISASGVSTINKSVVLNNLWAVELTLRTTAPVVQVPAQETLPSARKHASSAALGNDSILIFGGEVKGAGSFADTFVYNGKSARETIRKLEALFPVAIVLTLSRSTPCIATTFTWTDVTGTTGGPRNRNGAACATVEGNAYLFGGYDAGTHTYFNDVWQLLREHWAGRRLDVRAAH
ncbi:hypothetical protein BDK51DRAFT_37065 [Blyttiomyces helicus]|uniref:Uncharacterized protein n=1 Tax=Blyttiomyces helicus TaxID=388810 RepID=A0A4P9W1N5_9FUNG|nr:hypothetical protein BDK51DRAFT_37065 [Blyttiomyces helicus]|eukprot:RKO84658.1 hypothetical protein BDK51DRAFT_37065 [Blyttiomyces helicus]